MHIHCMWKRLSSWWRHVWDIRPIFIHIFCMILEPKKSLQMIKQSRRSFRKNHETSCWSAIYAATNFMGDICVLDWVLKKVSKIWSDIYCHQRVTYPLWDNMPPVDSQTTDILSYDHALLCQHHTWSLKITCLAQTAQL